MYTYMLEVAPKICGERADYLVNSVEETGSQDEQFLKNKNEFTPRILNFESFKNPRVNL